jgi:Na+/proline symporter
MVAAVAFESVVKLIAFLAVGFYVTYVMFAGFGDLAGRGGSHPDIAKLFTFGGSQSYGSWLWLIVLSMLAILLLPRQWQVAVVENVDERHIKTATWFFPLYLLLINIFVLPITVAGLLRFGTEGVSPDAFVLALPMAENQATLALLVFIGGLSAATGMVIVETIALSTMVSNSLVLPVLLRRGDALSEDNLGPRILRIRRVTIVVLLLLGYLYFRVAGDSLDLVSIGLISFAAVAQFAPAVLPGGWRPASWCGPTRCRCRRWRMQGCCRPRSSTTDRSASNCSPPTRCSAWTDWIRSAMRCCGAGWSTSACSSRCR